MRRMQSLLENRDTDFAPAFRFDSSQLKRQSTLIRTTGRIIDVLDAAPYIAVVTNTARQIVYGNSELYSYLGRDTVDIIGKRPGEMLGCTNAHDHPGGCGTGQNCRFCGAVAAILEALKTGERVTREAGLLIKQKEGFIAFDTNVTASPLNIGNEQYLIVFFDDISSRKRREGLERTFFHDVMNTASGLKNLALYLSDSRKNENDINHAAQLLVDQSSFLIEEIRGQQQLIEAESSTLAVNLQLIESLVLFTEARTAAEALRQANGKSIVSNAGSPSIGILTDPSLLKRVLLNMLKNALEATESGGEIRFSMNYESGDIVFKTWNPTGMNEEVKSRIFQRSFSTKGPGRGIGIYSMRLITEQYLHGSVSFTSNTDSGTEFTVRIPRTSKTPIGI
ncbi:MAG: sensor histidine kinase [Spirochaetes bacterium]|nr:MAG: sensor histidine kinase [Spirochaetota bacterium]